MVSPFISLHKILPLLGSNKHMTDPADDLDATDYNHQLNSQRCYNSCEATNIPSDSVVLSVWNNGRRLLGCVVLKFELFWDAGGPTTPSSILRKAISAILVKSIVSGWNYTDLVLVFFDDFIDNTKRPSLVTWCINDIFTVSFAMCNIQYFTKESVDFLNNLLVPTVHVMFWCVASCSLSNWFNLLSTAKSSELPSLCFNHIQVSLFSVSWDLSSVFCKLRDWFRLRAYCSIFKYEDTNCSHKLHFNYGGDKII